GTSVAVSYRTGNTFVPDGSWSAFTPVASPGGAVTGTSRYLQYRAALSTTDPGQTAMLSSVTASYQAGAPDTTPPAVIGRTPASGATGVPAGTNVSATFDEAMNPATLTTSSVRLRAQGAGSDVPATVSYNAATAIATLDPSADLDGGTVYTVTLASTITDTSGNALGSPLTWTFQTAAVAASFTD